MKAFLRRHVWILAGAAIAIAVVVILAPLASNNPDGLERVAQDKEFSDQQEGSGWKLLENYSVPGVDDGNLTVVLAGLVGVAIVFALPIGLGYMARRGNRSDSS